MNKILAYSLVIALGVIIALSYPVNKLREQNAVYKANQASLLDKVEYYRTKAEKSGASVQKLTLSYSELKDNYDKIVATAKDLDVKLKRLQSASTTVTKTEVKVVTVVKDSIVYRDGNADSILAFRWSDPWVDVKGEMEHDSVALDVQSSDTLMQIVHRVPHKFWFIKWGTKAIRQEVVSSNPHTNITYTEFIELK